MIQIKQGSLLDAEETIIAHQVNCFGVAGGLAYHVFEKWPDAKNDYQQITMRSSQFMGGLENLLGMVQLTDQQPDGKIIANLFGQFRPGTDYQPDVLRRTLENLSALAKSLGASVAMPYGISCGICGGDWNEVRQIIEETMQGVDVALYKLDEQERKPPMRTIVERIGKPALLEQTAEECAELAHACLKEARRLRGENPTPKSTPECWLAISEELADLQLCMELLEGAGYGQDPVAAADQRAAKLLRWRDRLDKAAEEDPR